MHDGMNPHRGPIPARMVLPSADHGPFGSQATLVFAIGWVAQGV